MSDDESDTFFYNGKNQYLDPRDMEYHGQINLKKLKNLRKKVDWQVKRERYELISQLSSLLRHWSGRLPNLQDIFRTDEIERLLTDFINCYENGWCDSQFIWFVTRTGYRNEPDLDDDGKPLLRRTTPIHHAARREQYKVVHQLFEIYNRFDVNYIDEFGLTHFHVACQSGCEDAVTKFLEHGQDPNLIVEKTGDSPLALAFKNTNKEVIGLLLRHGADPNVANAEGLTFLHVLSEGTLRVDCDYLIAAAEMLFKISEEKNQPLQIDARNNRGDTSLHLALLFYEYNLAKLLLEKGADPNVTNAEGSTALHMCLSYRIDNFAELIFEVSDKRHQLVRVNGRDKLGWTPLELAVKKLMPQTVDLLLDRGADLSDFVFPSETFFDFFEEIYSDSGDYELKLSSEMLEIIELLEKRGYELVRSDALTIMEIFGVYKLIDESEHLDSWLSNEYFLSITKEITITSSLTLYDLIQLRPDTAKNLVRREDYYEFAISHESHKLHKESRRVCVSHLYEKMWRGFCCRWALDSFLELTRHQLPKLCCEKIIENLINEDLMRICQAADIIANEQSKNLKKNCEKNIVSSQKNCKKNFVPSPKNCEKNTVSSPKNCKKNTVSSQKNCKKNIVPNQKNCEKNTVSSPKNCEKNIVSSQKNCKKNIVSSPKNCLKNTVSSPKNCKKNIVPGQKNCEKNTVSSPKNGKKNTVSSQKNCKKNIVPNQKKCKKNIVLSQKNVDYLEVITLKNVTRFAFIIVLFLSFLFYYF